MRDEYNFEGGVRGKYIRPKWKKWVLTHIWVPTGWKWALRLGRRKS